MTIDQGVPVDGTYAIARVVDYLAAVDHWLEQNLHGLSEDLVIDVRLGVDGQEQVLHVADLRAVMARLTDTCPDHAACRICERTLCDSCGIGERADCPARGLYEDGEHCDDCIGRCTDCQHAIGIEERAERRWSA